MEVEKLMSSSDKKNNNGDDDDDVLPPGFRFHPTDEELVGFYLKRKVEKKPLRIDFIRNVDVYKYEPWDLPKEVNSGGEREWYFFCRRGRKYKNSIRPNRVTGSGFWKATGIDKPIYSVPGFHDCIGLKKSLVYYQGSAGKGTKTDWMMHEFRLPITKSSCNLSNSKNINTQEAEVWTLCRIFKREVSYRKYTSEWRKPTSKQCSSDSSSRTSFSEAENRLKYESFEVSGDVVIGRKLHGHEHFYPNNDQFAGHVSLSTSQAPFMASYVSFSNQNEEESLRNGNWDELRPMVEYALDPSILYGFR